MKFLTFLKRVDDVLIDGANVCVASIETGDCRLRPCNIPFNMRRSLPRFCFRVLFQTDWILMDGCAATPCFVRDSRWY